MNFEVQARGSKVKIQIFILFGDKELHGLAVKDASYEKFANQHPTKVSSYEPESICVLLGLVAIFSSPTQTA